MNGTWQTIDLAGKPAEVYAPAGEGRPRFGILYLAPLGQDSLAGNTAFTRLFDEMRLGCVCPHGRRSWWVDRVSPEFDPAVTPERHLLANVVPHFDTAWGLKPPAIGLLGLSMGGQAALRLAFKYPQTFPVVAALSAAIEYHELYGLGTPLDEAYDSKEQCRQDTVAMHVHPANHPPHVFFACDPDDTDWHRGNDRLHEKLAALGAEHECDLTTRAGGHSWAYFNALAGRAVRFVNAGLEQMSRRLL